MNNNSVYIIRDGKLWLPLGELTNEWSLGDRVDDFSFNVSAKNDFFYYLTLTSEPYDVVQHYDQNYVRHEDRIETYSFFIRCNPTASYRATVS